MKSDAVMIDTVGAAEEDNDLQRTYSEDSDYSDQVGDESLPGDDKTAGDVAQTEKKTPGSKAAKKQKQFQLNEGDSTQSWASSAADAAFDDVNNSPRKTSKAATLAKPNKRQAKLLRKREAPCKVAGEEFVADGNIDQDDEDNNIIHVCGLRIDIEEISKAEILKMRKHLPKKDYR